MKKEIALLLGLLGLTLSIFTGCSKDEAIVPPTIAAFLVSNPSYEQGTFVTYRIGIESKEDLLRFTPLQSTNSEPAWEVENLVPANAFDGNNLMDFSEGLKFVLFDFTYHIPENVDEGTTISLYFEVKDKKSKATDTVSFIVVEAPHLPTIVVTQVGNPTYTPGTSVSYHLVITSYENLVDFWCDESSLGMPFSTIENVIPSNAIEGGSWVNFSDNITLVEFDYTYNIGTTLGPGTDIILEFEVWDEKNLMTTETVIFTVVPGAGAIDRFTSVMMGGQSNLSIGAFLDASTGDVYLQVDANSSQESIDFLYYYGSTHLATLCAPNEPSVGGGGPNLSLCENWTTKNPTKFGPASISSAEFDAMTDDSMLSTITGLSASKMTNLSVGDIFAFTTVENKNGLVKVKALTADPAGSITLDVVIQK